MSLSDKLSVTNENKDHTQKPCCLLFMISVSLALMNIASIGCMNNYIAKILYTFIIGIISETRTMQECALCLYSLALKLRLWHDL